MSFKATSSNAKVKPIFYALESKNYKRVKYLIDDLVKEKPNNVNYQLIKNYCNIIINNNYDIESTLSIMDNAQNYNELIKFENLELILEILKISNFENWGKIFEIILKKQPSNLPLIKYWNKSALENLKLFSLQKSSVQLSKFDNLSSSDRKRQLVFISCFNYYLICLNELKVDALHRKLYSSLALKLLGNMEPLKSDQEYFLKFKLLQIDSNEANRNLLIEIMDKQLLVKKKITEIDITLILIYIQTLKDAKNFEKLYNFTSECIFTNKINDYNFWNFCLLSSFKTNRQDELLKNLIKNYNTEKDRNVILTLINYSILKKEIDDIKKYSVYYFKNFGDRKVCFVDLKRIFQFLVTRRSSSDVLDWFVGEIITYINGQLIFTSVEQISRNKVSNGTEKLNTNQVSLLVNLQKFKMFNLSLKDKKPKEEIENILVENFNIFDFCYKRFLVHNKESMKNDYFIGNELLLMNCQLEIQMMQNTASLNELALKYFVLLKFALTYSPQDFLIKLWLMIFQNYLNLPLLTIDTFESLSIKNIQVDTLNYFLSIRMSSRYPNLEKNATILSNMEFYNKEYTMDYLISVLESCYENQSFSKIEKYFEFLNMLIHSYERWSSTFEIVQCNLMIGSNIQSNKFQKINNDYRNMLKMNFINNMNQKHLQNSNEEKDDFDKLLTFNTDGTLSSEGKAFPFERYDLTFGYSDNRDFKSLWGSLPTIVSNKDQEKSNFELYFTGPTPKENYLKLMNLKSNILQDNENIASNERLGKFFETYCKILESIEFKIDSEFTEAEALDIQLFHNLWKYFMNVDNSDYLDKIKQLICELTDVFNDLIDIKNKWINWEFTHSMITIINISNNFKKQLKLLKTFLNNSKNTNHELKIREIENSYGKLTDSIKAVFSDDKILKNIFDDNLQKSKDYLISNELLLLLLKQLNIPDSFISNTILILQHENTEMYNMVSLVK